ncbi:MAG: aldo/keto reductase [Sutterella sp.]|nr:aldo/keto reductase [Sutterella sp.]
MFRSFYDRLQLANGVNIPCIGFGTWQVPNDSPLVSAVTSALQLGYRSFDTAQIYGNASALGRALREGEVPREELFLTSKIWVTHRHPEGVHRAFSEMLDQLKTNYLDMLLIHWPCAQGEPMIWQSVNVGTWRALEDLYLEGRVRAIGVSNFLPHHLVPLLARARIAPMINQLELHPGYPQNAAVNFCLKHNIPIQAWSPLGRGMLLRNPLIHSIAQKHKVTPAQVALRWCLQHGFMPIVKALDMGHQKQNLDVFSFILDAVSMKELDSMPQTAFSGLHPDTVTF